ncbi:unnamed protein product [Medioppia subpectinata]|uniref:Putative alpha-L-fucosidase n=1 Tax=Medioppia subpectinata TaxID=1979941 RepID=A0A7R9KDW4_9ACAR|nr:unnamed protein product [Medioppia subpectinata]CAG2101364.1 unnamed protein product [Medioppia subpectinata]
MILNKLIYLLPLIALLIYETNGVEDKNPEVGANRYTPDWKSLDSRPLPGWYDQAKFGIMMHWGVYSVLGLGGEWIWYRWKVAHEFKDYFGKYVKPGVTYQDFANEFTTELFDPNKWADIIKASGAKYVVLTTKHHEGFTLWPSNYSWSWNAMDVGAHRDLVGELSTAVRKAGLRFGTYHSLMEWFHPLFLKDQSNKWKTNEFVTNKINPEMIELVEKYKPDIIWSDGDAGAPDTYWKSLDFLAWLYNDRQDEVIVNDRWGGGTACKHGGFYNCKDRYLPSVVQPHKWENALSVDHGGWSYTRQFGFNDYMTTYELISQMAQTISCGGNILINIGPTPDGRIIPLFEEILRDIGSWMSVNGESIYGTNPWTHQNDTVTDKVWYTKKEKTVYSIVLFWPKNYDVILGAVDHNTVQSIQLLGTTGNLVFKAHEDKGTVVTFPFVSPDTLRFAYVLKINFK